MDFYTPTDLYFEHLHGRHNMDQYAPDYHKPKGDSDRHNVPTVAQNLGQKVLNEDQLKRIEAGRQAGYQRRAAYWQKWAVEQQQCGAALDDEKQRVADSNDASTGTITAIQAAYERRQQHSITTLAQLLAAPAPCLFPPCPVRTGATRRQRFRIPVPK